MFDLLIYFLNGIYLIRKYYIDELRVIYNYRGDKNSLPKQNSSRKIQMRQRVHHDVDEE